MKILSLILALCLMLCPVYAFAETADKVTFSENGQCMFSLEVPENPASTVKRAADVTAEVLEKITGDSRKAEKDRKILVRQLPAAGDDGYTVTVSEDEILIEGRGEKGCANGMYGFLKDYLGVMFLTAKDTYIPDEKNIYLEKGSRDFAPALLWRDVYSYETSFDGWGDKLRLNAVDSSENPAPDNIETVHHYDWGSWCHNCYSFLSPDEYFESHPEYFSEYKGERITSYKGRDAYLCLSNPEVLKIVKENMRKKMEENPDKIYWDFSGNDNPYLAGCQCEECKRLDKKAGGTGMGTLLPFLNELAKEFPDKYISTLAYLHTLKVPENIVPEKNVVIKLCSMPGDQAYSYLEGGNSDAEQFSKQVKQWAEITDKIIVWDYTVNFSHLLLPFPNIGVQRDNQKFYEDNGVIGVFHQSSREKGGEFSELRAYVLSELMWYGSELDVEKCTEDYVKAYYKSAAPEVMEYIKQTGENLKNSGSPLGLYDSPSAHRKSYLSAENILSYKEIFDRAKEKAAGDEELLTRLETLEIPVLYALITHPETVKDEYKARFISLTDEKGIDMVCEWITKEDFFGGEYEKGLKNEIKAEKRPYIIAASVMSAMVIIVIAVSLLKIRKKFTK